jgi:hypothetical protein
MFSASYAQRADPAQFWQGLPEFGSVGKNVIYLQPIIRYDKTISEDDQSRSNT